VTHLCFHLDLCIMGQMSEPFWNGNAVGCIDGWRTTPRFLRRGRLISLVTIMVTAERPGCLDDRLTTKNP
jgi:hypothetical protein